MSGPRLGAAFGSFVVATSVAWLGLSPWALAQSAPQKPTGAGTITFNMAPSEMVRGSDWSATVAEVFCGNSQLADVEGGTPRPAMGIRGMLAGKYLYTALFTAQRTQIGFAGSAAGGGLLEGPPIGSYHFEKSISGTVTLHNARDTTAAPLGTVTAQMTCNASGTSAAPAAVTVATNSPQVGGMGDVAKPKGALSSALFEGVAFIGVVGVSVALYRKRSKRTGYDFEDIDLAGAAAAWTADKPAKVLTDVDAARDWKVLVDQEAVIQASLLDAFQNLMAGVANNQAEYNKAFDDYRTAYGRVLSGSTEMQGMIQAWMESKETLAKADLAFAILTLLLSGVGLGLKGIQMLRGARIAAAGADAARAAEGVEGVGTALNAAAGASKGQGAMLARVDARIAESLAREAGVSLPEMVAKHGGDTAAAVAEISQKVFSKRGWHYLRQTRLAATKADRAAKQQGDVAAIVARVVTRTRTGLNAATRRGAMTSAPFKGGSAGGVLGPSAAGLKEDIAILRRLQRDDPRFLASLKTAVVDMVEPALTRPGMGAAPATVTEGLLADISFARAQNDVAKVKQLELLIRKSEQMAAELGNIDGKIVTRILTDADHALLLKSVEAGGDIAKLQTLMGPAQTIVLEQVVARAGVTAVAADATRQAMSETFEAGNDVQVTDVAHFVNQFGVANRLNDSRNVGTFMGGEVWHFVSAPFTTVGEHYYSHEALDAQHRFMEEHGADLQAMASALQRAGNTAGGMQRAIHNAHLGDPSSPLGGGAAADLRKVLDKMKEALDSSSPAFREQHAPDLKKRMDHVAQKLGTVEHATAELKALSVKLPQMEKWLNELRLNPDGSARPVTEGIDPQALMRIGSGFLYLNGVMGSIVAGPTVPAGVAPANGKSGALVDETPDTKKRGKKDPCDSERTAWAQARQHVFNLNSRIGPIRDAAAEAQRAEKAAAQHQANASNPAAYAKEHDDALADVKPSLDRLADAEKELADAQADEAAKLKALDECEMLNREEIG